MGGTFDPPHLGHLIVAGEMLSATLATIHNERFTVRLVDRMREALKAGDFYALRDEFLGRFYAAKG